MRTLSGAWVLAAALIAVSPVALSAQTPPVPAGAPAAHPGVVAGPVDPSTMLYPRSPSGSGAAKEGAMPSGIMATGVVVLAGAAGGWLLWRRLRGGISHGGRDEHKLAIAETRSLGNRQYLVVAAYGDRRYLLGVCPGKIDLISPLDDPHPPAAS
jgi:flagellar protein FliO/FliZ